MTLSELLNSDMTTLARMARGGFDWWLRELEDLLLRPRPRSGPEGVAPL
jgi:hypothetical protein